MRTANLRPGASRVKALFRAAVVMCACAGTVGTLTNVLRQYRNPHAEYGEGIVLWQSKHMLDTQYVYRRIDSPPYNVTHYPPLFHLVARAIYRLTHNWLTAGRLVSIFAAMGSALIIGYTTFLVLPRRFSLQDRISSALFAGSALFALPEFGWLTLARVDSLGLFFGYSALALFTAGGENMSFQILSLVLMVASGFAKQSLVSVPITCLLFELIIDRRRFVRLFVILVLLVAAPLAVLQIWTHEGFLLNLVIYNVNEFSPVPLVYNVGLLLDQNIPLLAMSLPMILYTLAWTWNRSGRSSYWWQRKMCTSTFRRGLAILTLHAFVSGATLVSMGKVGGGLNYALVLQLNLLILCGTFLAQTLQSWSTEDRSPATYLAVILPALFTGLIVWAGRPHLASDLTSRAGERPALIRVLRTANGPIYSEDMAALLEAGKEVFAEPAIVTTLHNVGLWNEDPLLNMIRHRKFSLIAVGNLEFRDRFTPTVSAAIKDFYYDKQIIDGLHLYYPRP